jgi:hypothetical protein
VPTSWLDPVGFHRTLPVVGWREDSWGLLIEGLLSADSVEKVGHGLRIKKVRARD